jgi:hypothetical protein
MAAELETWAGPGDTLEYGWTCHPCQKQRRCEGGQRHAENSMALHNRTFHTSPILNLSALARIVGQGSPSVGAATWEAWKALTGLDDDPARVFLEGVLGEPSDLVVHIAPF